MTDEFDDPEEEIEFYRGIVDTLENWNWELEEREEPPSAEDIRMQDETLNYAHEYDRGGLTSAMFDISTQEDTPLVSGNLSQPLDTSIPQDAFEQSDFLQAYLDKVDRIVEERGNDYTRPVEDPFIVMAFELPREDREELESLLYSISDVSNQVQAVHDAMLYPVEDFWPEPLEDY
ncbi:MAG: hypothetical protein ABEJ69_01215 [Candidatus Nanohaloarchaea archaeon]